MGKGIFHAPKIPITAGRDLNALSNALLKQQEDFVKNAASKLIPNGGGASQYGNGAADPSKPATNGEAAGANVPVPDGAPYADGVNKQSGVPNSQGVSMGQTQPQATSDGYQHPDLLQKAAYDVHAINKQALGTAHDAAHGFVGNLPGGNQASQFTHGLAQNFIPGSIAAGTGGGDQSGQQQQSRGFF